MVAKYRWDFIGLSTFTKPTPATSEKVVNGSTYYCSDTSKLYVWCKDNWYEKKPLGGGTTYTAGDGIDITDSTISVDTTTIQPKLTAGTNITISDENVISASGGGVTVVQTTGTSTTDVMSQKAASDMVYRGGDNTKIQIGSGANNQLTGDNLAVAIGSGGATQAYSVALGAASGCSASAISSIALQGSASGHSAVALGVNSQATARGAVAIGRGAYASNVGEINVGCQATSDGYNSSLYRLISGVHDGVNANDAATVGQLNALITAINTALNTNISTIGS